MLIRLCVGLFNCIDLNNQLYIIVQLIVSGEPMEYRLNKDTLLDILGSWTPFIRRKIRMVACGGTALTLMGFKESTKDVDFIIPVESEYKYLIKALKDLGYRETTGSGWKKENDVFIIDLFVSSVGNRLRNIFCRYLT